MSDYRDDTVETAVIGDEAWGGFRGKLVEDYARIAAAMIVSIGVLHTEQAVASDAVIDRHVGMLVEQAAASDEALGAMHVAGATITESGTVRDRVIDRTRAVLTEAGVLADQITIAAGDLVTETAAVSDTLTGVLHAHTTVHEAGRVSDALVRHLAELVAESATAADSVTDRLRAGGLLVEAAALEDETPGAHAAFGHVAEVAALADEASGLLHAATLIEEAAAADAMIVSDEITGQAWVSEADNWAMSRYAPFGFQAAAAVDGVVYLAGPDGLYALDGEAEPIEARLRTGKVDVSGGSLAKPVAMYLEYALAGEIDVTVGQTQSGALQQWTYPLPAKPADELTNGRAPFGRGLRGRHFSFELRMAGTSGYINDATVLVEKTSRRI